MDAKELKSIPYADFVNRLCMDGQKIIDQMTPEKAHLLHMGVGVGGEAGELQDALKRFCLYNKDMDRLNVIEELGDLKFFIRGIQNQTGITDEEIEMHNKTKLSIRYAGLVYTDAAAQQRADKL